MVGSCLTCGDRGKGYLHASNIVPKQKQSLSTQQQPHYNEKAFIALQSTDTLDPVFLFEMILIIIIF